MFAKAGLAVEPECVGSVFTIQPRTEGVLVAARAQLQQHRQHQRFAIGVGIAWVLAQRLGPGQCSGVASLGQGQGRTQLGRTGVQAIAECGVAIGLVAHHTIDWAVHRPLQIGMQVAAVATDLGCIGCGVEYQQPGALIGLQRHLVVHWSARYCNTLARICQQRAVGLGPAATIKMRQNWPPEIHFLGRRQDVLKAYPQGDAGVQCQHRDTADLHVAPQSAIALGRGAGQAPQGRNAGEQHKQRQHDGRSPCDQQQRRSQ